MSTHPEMFPQARTRRGKGGKRADLGDCYFRSSWEANYARYLNFLQQHGNIAAWAYEVEVFEFTKIKKGSRFYTPDFRVINTDGSVEYHEVKGYMDERSATKLHRMARYYPHIKLILIERDAYYAIANEVRCLIPEWEWTRQH